MKVLVDDRWTAGYLDPSPGPHEYLLVVTHWITGPPVRGLFIERPRSARLVVHYVRSIGVRGTLRRIRSRRAERVRNRRFVAFGVGRVLCAPPGDGTFEAGTAVSFVAPAAPVCADRIAVHAALVRPGPASVPTVPPGTLLHARFDAPSSGLEAVAGWSPWSGAQLDEEAVAEAHAACDEALSRAAWHDATRLAASTGPPASTAGGVRPRSGGRPAAVLVGYGNYAKTTILPNVAHRLDVLAVHEIDPLQLGRRRPRSEVEWSTDPEPDVDRFDAVLAAGYHHTHAPLAAEALARGKAAVVEKPLATTHTQLDLVADAAERGGGRLFVCFQRRHMLFNDYAREDLGHGDPVDYHCVVYEEPLPARHWYAWPNSGSRLVSNGCHWVDHFLYLNGFSAPLELRAESPRRDLVNVTVRLENGAVFTMALTDVGSRRVGLREHVELRARDVTATIVDGSRYEAESSRRRLRRASVNKLDAYRHMYRTIAARIADGGPGDDLQDDLLSARVTLDLEQALGGREGVARTRAPRPALRGG